MTVLRLFCLVLILSTLCAVGCSKDDTPTQKEVEQSQTKGTDLDPAYTK